MMFDYWVSVDSTSCLECPVGLFCFADCDMYELLVLEGTSVGVTVDPRVFLALFASVSPVLSPEVFGLCLFSSLVHERHQVLPETSGSPSTFSVPCIYNWIRFNLFSRKIRAFLVSSRELADFVMVSEAKSMAPSSNSSNLTRSDWSTFFLMFALKVSSFFVTVSRSC